MMPLKTFVARAGVASGLFGLAMFAAIRLATADPGGPTRAELTYSGVLRNRDWSAGGSIVLTFAFTKTGGAVCVPPSVTAVVTAGGAFTVPLPLGTCANFFDGSDITYTVTTPGDSTPLAADVRVTPVPYARFADQAGVANAARRPGPYGLTLAYDATPTSPNYGQLCVQCNNQPCSESNPGFVAFGGPLPGQLIVDRFVSAACIRDAHATSSDLGGHPFGTTGGVAWGEDRPFALYACRSAAGPLIGLAPDPTKIATPDAAFLATPRVPGSSQSDATMLVWGGTAEPGRPCVLLGSIRMRKNTSDAWEVRPLDYGDGIDNNANFMGRIFTMPPGHFGAVPGQYLTFDRTVEVMDTLPTYTTRRYTYSIGLDGRVSATFAFSNTSGGTPGRAGAGALRIIHPYRSTIPSFGQVLGTAYINNRSSPDAPALLEHLASIAGDSGNASPFIFDDSAISGVNLVRGNHQSGQVRELNGTFTYWAFRVQ